MAKNKEFDILVIYHSNRLGRLHNDTPLVIKQLNEDNVKVISVIEGEEGRYRGGAMLPLGYQLQDGGNRNYKGRENNEKILQLMAEKETYAIKNYR